MSTSTPSSKGSNAAGASGYVPRSDYAIIKDGGWRSYNNFMHSYGLKPWNDDDVQEGKAILNAFREADKEEYDEAQKK